MKTYQIKITGKTPYSQSRHYSEDDVPKLEKESHESSRPARSTSSLFLSRNEPHPGSIPGL